MMKSDKLPIVEIFSSIQGEGIWMGAPALFIRFAGCNLACPFCDTDFETARLQMTVEDIGDEIILRKGEFSRVVFTGGEPLLHAEAIEQLIDELPQITFSIETNGTIPLETAQYGIDIWVTMSPKIPRNICKVESCEEIKILYPYLEGIPADDWQDFHAGCKFIQPIHPGNDAGYRKNIEGALKEISRLNASNNQLQRKWRLGVQLHKLINVR